MCKINIFMDLLFFSFFLHIFSIHPQGITLGNLNKTCVLLFFGMKKGKNKKKRTVFPENKENDKLPPNVVCGLSMNINSTSVWC